MTALKDKLLADPLTYFKTHRIGELYFRFIKGTRLEANGWNATTLAEKLELWGFIKRLEAPAGPSYFNLPGKSIARKDLVALILTQCPKPAGILRRMFRNGENV